MTNGKKADPTIIIIFGGTGDLAKRKLIPAFVIVTVAAPGAVAFAFTIIG